MTESGAVPPTSSTTPPADGGGQIPGTGSATTGGAGGGTSSSTTAPTTPSGEPIPHWLPDRLDRAKGQGKKEILEQFGFNSEKDALDTFNRLKEFEKSQLSETDRAKREADEQKARADALEAKLRDRETSEQQVAAQGALKKAAIAAGVKDTSTKYVSIDLKEHIEGNPTLKALRDAGQDIPPALLEPFFASLKTASPHFFGATETPVTTGPTTQTPPQTPPPGGSPPASEDFTKMDGEAWKKKGVEKYGVHV